MILSNFGTLKLVGDQTNKQKKNDQEKCDLDIGESELEHKWRWLVAEEERLVEMRTAIQWQSEELEERQSVLDKREMALDKSHQSEGDRQLSGSIELGARRKKDPVYEDKVSSKLIKFRKTKK